MTRIGALIIFLLFGSACGVKGTPLPPLEAPPIGNGKPLQEKEIQKKKVSTDGSKKKDEHSQ